MRSLVIIVASLLLACTPKEGTLTGEVFTVLPGGRHIYISDMTVVAISEGLVSTFLEERRNAAASQAQVNLQEARDRVESAKSALQAAETRKAKAMAAIQAGTFLDQLTCFNQGLDNLLADLEPDEYAPAKPDPLCRRLFEANDEVDKRKKLLARRQAEAEGTEAEGGFTESSGFYLEGLEAALANAATNTATNTEGPPAVLAKTKTNADGRFTMTLPRQGRFALAAYDTRGGIGETDNYFWLVWTSLDGAAEKHIILANDNVTTSGSPESVIAVLR